MSAVLCPAMATQRLDAGVAAASRPDAPPEVLPDRHESCPPPSLSLTRALRTIKVERCHSGGCLLKSCSLLIFNLLILMSFIVVS